MYLECSAQAGHASRKRQEKGGRETLGLEIQHKQLFSESSKVGTQLRGEEGQKQDSRKEAGEAEPEQRDGTGSQPPGGRGRSPLSWGRREGPVGRCTGKPRGKRRRKGRGGGKRTRAPPVCMTGSSEQRARRSGRRQAKATRGLAACTELVLTLPGQRQDLIIHIPKRCWPNPTTGRRTLVEVSCPRPTHPHVTCYLLKMKVRF